MYILDKISCANQMQGTRSESCMSPFVCFSNQIGALQEEVPRKKKFTQIFIGINNMQTSTPSIKGVQKIHVEREINVYCNRLLNWLKNFVVSGSPQIIHQFTQLPTYIVKINDRVVQHIYLSRCMKGIITNYKFILSNSWEKGHFLQRRSLSRRGSLPAVCKTEA
jgi:hypothetical protein